MIDDIRHKTNSAFGAGVLLAVFTVKATIYDRMAPSTWTPLVVAVLGCMSLLAFARYAGLRRRVQRPAVRPAAEPVNSAGAPHPAPVER